uniref:CSC1/OSCA1-like 7TM region domain-containing protein n=1 Tax=Fagus sylvatica TaxID=28930 RepID=A0A2N9GXG7_FAGSY
MCLLIFWSGIAVEILRLVPLVMFHLKNTFLVKTEQDREQAMDPGCLDFATSEPRIQCEQNKNQPTFRGSWTAAQTSSAANPWGCKALIAATIRVSGLCKRKKIVC